MIFDLLKFGFIWELFFLCKIFEFIICLIQIRFIIVMINYDKYPEDNKKYTTCFASGNNHRSTWWTSTNIVYSNNIHLVFSIRAEIPYRVEHCDDATNFAEGLIGVLRFKLNNVVLQIFWSIVRPSKSYRCCRNFRYFNINWRAR